MPASAALITFLGVIQKERGSSRATTVKRRERVIFSVANSLLAGLHDSLLLYKFGFQRHLTAFDKLLWHVFTCFKST